MYRVVIKNSAKPDLKKLKRSNLKGSFMQIIADLKSDPYRPTQSFEKLQPTSRGLYSRRINSQHRVVYEIDDEARTVTIYAAWSHYE
ncbi:Txe/YoeB family addiction module toxin [Bifidobacterium sp. ESL0763]|uniref:Txe/YoeB family addiction module toxin n=1 Tax=Bifidobacterium sp. ESL0763 TaxID=2983227 RepID=UPI0023F993D1|nr:Txe/YoeB family addiction module toxin [Bifidobacterium sp. ESL0763]MDF7664502.1 Txe/YoeB family addiction module toxin [Bifidobacterium sp. ESL0763]